MARHHHVNLAVPPGGVGEQRSFLVDVLGYRQMELSEAVKQIAPRAQWFETDDGSQIHLSEDEAHRPADRAHVAVEFDEDELSSIRGKLDARGLEFSEGDARPGFPRTLFVRDPAGNRWELRGSARG